MVYLIIGKYRGSAVVIDEAQTEREAEYLVREYQLAYGSEWIVYYVEDQR